MDGVEPVGSAAGRGSLQRAVAQHARTAPQRDRALENSAARPRLLERDRLLIAGEIGRHLHRRRVPERWVEIRGGVPDAHVRPGRFQIEQSRLSLRIDQLDAARRHGGVGLREGGHVRVPDDRLDRLALGRLQDAVTLNRWIPRGKERGFEHSRIRARFPKVDPLGVAPVARRELERDLVRAIGTGIPQRRQHPDEDRLSDGEARGRTAVEVEEARERSHERGRGGGGAVAVVGADRVPAVRWSMDHVRLQDSQLQRARLLTESDVAAEDPGRRSGLGQSHQLHVAAERRGEPHLDHVLVRRHVRGRVRDLHVDPRLLHVG